MHLRMNIFVCHAIEREPIPRINNTRQRKITIASFDFSPFLFLIFIYLHLHIAFRSVSSFFSFHHLLIFGSHFIFVPCVFWWNDRRENKNTEILVTITTNRECIKKELHNKCHCTKLFAFQQFQFVFGFFPVFVLIHWKWWRTAFENYAYRRQSSLAAYKNFM